MDNKQRIWSYSEPSQGDKLVSWEKCHGAETIFWSQKFCWYHWASSKVVVTMVRRGKTEQGEAVSRLQSIRNNQEWRKDEHQELSGNHYLKFYKSFHEISLKTHKLCTCWANLLIYKQQLLVSLGVKFTFRTFLVAYNNLIPFNLMLFYAFIYAKLKYFVKAEWKSAHNFWCKFKTEEILQT